MKLVPFESLGAVTYSPPIVIMGTSVVYCEIFKEWCDLENQVRGCSKSLKMDGEFDRPYATFYFRVI